MSQENVEVVRSIMDAHERGDFDAVFAGYDPEIEWHLSPVFARVSDFESVYYGHEGVRAFWRRAALRSRSRGDLQAGQD